MSDSIEKIPEQCLSNYPSADNPFRMYDPQNPADVNLGKNLQKELNEISSAPCTIYLLQDTEIDPLLGETKSAIYGKPIYNVIGHFSPQSVKFELAKWGIDSDIDMILFFTKDEVISKCGRVLQHGDLILDIYNRLFEITEHYDDTNFNYTWISQYVLCKRHLGDASFLAGEYKNKPEGETNADTQAIKDDQNKNFFSY
jgi:hypothetical protein